MKKVVGLLLALSLLVAVAGNTEDASAEGAVAMGAKEEIAELINDWGFNRDQERWHALSAAFYPEGTISLSWYDGPYAGFVEASKMIAARGAAVLKHQLGVPSIRVMGDRAVSEVNVIIMLRTGTEFGDVDTSSYARFVDLLERRDGAWKIVKRTAIYEKDRIDPVDMPVLPDALFVGLEEFPVELRFLGSSMSKGGIALSPTVVLDKSPEMQAVYAAGEDWLGAQ